MMFKVVKQRLIDSCMESYAHLFEQFCSITGWESLLHVVRELLLE